MSESLTEVKSQLHRAKAYIDRMKAGNEEVIGRATSGAMAMSGGVFAAVLEAKLPHVPGTTFPSRVAVGALAAAVGLADGAGKFSDQLAAFGWGCLTTQAFDSTKKALAA